MACLLPLFIYWCQLCRPQIRCLVLGLEISVLPRTPGLIWRPESFVLPPTPGLVLGPNSSILPPTPGLVLGPVILAANANACKSPLQRLIQFSGGSSCTQPQEHLVFKLKHFLHSKPDSYL